MDGKYLKSIYHAIFESHSFSSSLVRAQNSISYKTLFAFQKKSLRIIYFQNHNAHTSQQIHSCHLFSESNILNLPDKFSLENVSL